MSANSVFDVRLSANTYNILIPIDLCTVYRLRFTVYGLRFTVYVLRFTFYVSRLPLKKRLEKCETLNVKRETVHYITRNTTLFGDLIIYLFLKAKNPVKKTLGFLP